MAAAPETHHGTAIAVGGNAALILGASGAGKSDLALRCVMRAPTQLVPEPVLLVADDRVHIEGHAGRVRVRAPGSILGQLEVRGMGIVEVPYVPEADLVLCVELAAAGTVERLPDPPPERVVAGVRLPVLRLSPFEAAAPEKLLLALMRAAQAPGRGTEA